MVTSNVIIKPNNNVPANYMTEEACKDKLFYETAFKIT